MTTETNPLLTGAYRIPFQAIRAEHVEPGIRQALADAQVEVDAVASERSAPSWDNTLGRLDRALETLSERMAPVGHLVSVAETQALRDAYNAVLPEISTFWSSIPLNAELWKRLEGYAATDEAATLEGIRRRHLDKTVDEFKRAGADLPTEQEGVSPGPAGRTGSNPAEVQRECPRRDRGVGAGGHGGVPTGRGTRCAETPLSRPAPKRTATTDGL